MSIKERYRGHLILVKAHQEPDGGAWKATVHIQFNEDNLTSRDVQLPERTARFTIEKKAERYALKEGKKWVDSRVRQAKIFERRENRQGQSLRRIIWFTVAIVGSCIIGLLMLYVQKAGFLEKAFDDLKTVTSYRDE
jgi:hypothetical protein